jgi:hypothetical protein
VSQTNEEAFELVPHHRGTIRGIPWPVCARCGHVYFTNPLAMWVLKMGCDHKWHPDWKRVRVTLVRQHQKEKGIT